MPNSASRPSVLLVHERYRQRAGEDTVFDAEVKLLRSNGHQVRTLIVDNDAIPDQPSTGQRLRLGVETIWSARAGRLMAQAMEDGPDVVHVHNTFPLLSPSIYRVAKQRGAAVVQTLHNYRLVCPAATLFRDGRPCEDCVGRPVALPGLIHGCYRDSRLQTLPVVAMLATHRALGTWEDVDAFIALTDFAATKLVRGGLPSERIHIKANFVAPDPGEREGPGRDFLFVGRLTIDKGIRTIIDAAAQGGPEITVRIAGDGPESDRVTEAAERHAGVVALGRLSPSDVRTELARSRALVFPSIWYEGMPMTILEAFAAGVPVIAARIGAAAALVEDRVTGLTFAPGDGSALAACLAWASRHPAEMAAFGHAARSRYLERFTAAVSYRRLQEIYQLALERRTGRAGVA